MREAVLYVFWLSGLCASLPRMIVSVIFRKPFEGISPNLEFGAFGDKDELYRF